MSESVHTEFVNARKMFDDKTAPRPFKEKVVGKAPVMVGLDASESTYIRTGLNHHRSMAERATSKALVWGGPLPGDIYGETTIKGAAMRTAWGPIKIEENEYTSFGIRGHGLMDDYDLPNIIKTSNFLRENGLPTEKPVRVMELKEVYVGSGKQRHKIPIEEWEKQQLESFRGTEMYDKVRAYLKQTKFITLERDVQIDMRLQDLETLPLEADLIEEMRPVFKWLNAATNARGEGLIAGTPKPEPFQPTANDFKRYFESWLPSQIGTFLGRMHRLRLCHQFPHRGNWSIVGTLYDLDSVTGKVLFSDYPEPTDEEYGKDIQITLKVLRSMNYSITDRPADKVPEIRSYETDYHFARSYFLEKYKGRNVTFDQVGQNQAELLLLQIIEMYIPPDSRTKQDATAPRLGKFQRLLNLITRKKDIKLRLR